MELSIFQRDLIWEIGILCGFPLCLVVLGELSERLERQGNPLGL